MTFWPRMFCAVVCWFLSMLVALALGRHYLLVMSVPASLGQEILLILGIGVAAAVTLVATLVFWLWVWTSKYW